MNTVTVTVGEGLFQRSFSKIEVESTPGKPVKENEAREGNSFTLTVSS
jgi:hypothetical protein